MKKNHKNNRYYSKIDLFSVWKTTQNQLYCASACMECMKSYVINEKEWNFLKWNCYFWFQLQLQRLKFHWNELRSLNSTFYDENTSAKQNTKKLVFMCVILIYHFVSISFISRYHCCDTMLSLYSWSIIQNRESYSTTLLEI